MTLKVKDSGHASGSLDDGQSLTVELDSDGADVVKLFIDGGATGTRAATYDLTFEVYVPAYDDWMEHSTVTGEDALSWQDTPDGPRVRYVLTNTSGSNGEQYRTRAVSYQQQTG